MNFVPGSSSAPSRWDPMGEGAGLEQRFGQRLVPGAPRDRGLLNTDLSARGCVTRAVAGSAVIKVS